jgi:hypothetical protein
LTTAVNNNLSVESLTDDLGTVNGITVSGNVQLTTSGTSNVTLNSNVASTGSGSIGIASGNQITLNSGGISTVGNVVLASGGSITEAGNGAINASTLSTSAVGGITLTNANNVAAFSAINSGGGNVQLMNTAPSLSITGVTQTGGGNVIISSAGSLSNTSPITSSGGGNISLTAVGTTTINSPISAGSTGNISLTTTGGSNSSILLNTGSLITSNQVQLNSTGLINEVGPAIIEANTLIATTQLANGINLNNPNVVSNFIGQAPGGTIYLNSILPLTVTISGGATVNIQLNGQAIQSQTVNSLSTINVANIQVSYLSLLEANQSSVTQFSDNLPGGIIGLTSASSVDVTSLLDNVTYSLQDISNTWVDQETDLFRRKLATNVGGIIGPM